MKYFAVMPFSMERAVKQELERMKVEVSGASEGKVFFLGNTETLADVCVNLRSGDRVFMEIASFTAVTFDELFDNIRKIGWAEIIAPNGKINVSAKCAKSTLMSPSDVQKISKMAIVKAMQASGIKRVSETGSAYPIDVHINKNNVTVALDMCGVSLHKRGYRVKNAEAPLRETLAAGLIELSGWRSNNGFCDPFCGSGTLVIEAAMKALNIAPGMNRDFICENFKNIDRRVFDNARKKAKNSVQDKKIFVCGGDILPEMVEMTQFHAERAGVDRFISVEQCAAKYSYPQSENGTLITNPPYGARLKPEMNELYSQINQVIENYSLWNKFFFSGDKNFEKNAGKRADKTRRFYNGNIECNLFNYFCEK